LAKRRIESPCKDEVGRIASLDLFTVQMNKKIATKNFHY